MEVILRKDTFFRLSFVEKFVLFLECPLIGVSMMSVCVCTCMQV